MSEPAPTPVHPSGEDILPGRLRRFAPLLGAFVVGIALVGYLRGISEFRPIARLEAAASEDDDQGVPAAVRYADLPGARLRPNAGWHSQLLTLKSERPGVF